MKKIAVLTAMVSLMLLAVACGTTSEQGEDMGGMDDVQAQYNKVIKQAETAFKDVDQVGGAWAFTEDMIKDAKTKASQNKFDEALKLAKEAYEQAVMANAQFEEQKNAGPYLF